MYYDIPAPYCEGLLSLQVAVEEPIKLALCSVLQHLCDCLVQHRVESTVAFAASYVDSLRRDQKERYEKTFVKKPREFRSPPKKQVTTRAYSDTADTAMILDYVESIAMGYPFCQALLPLLKNSGFV